MDGRTAVKQVWEQPIWQIDRSFEPQMERKEMEEKLHGWKKAVACSYGWAKEQG